MKKTYITPALVVVSLGSGPLCESIIVGSGRTDETTGNGVDLTKDQGDWDDDLWDD